MRKRSQQCVIYLIGGVCFLLLLAFQRSSRGIASMEWESLRVTNSETADVQVLLENAAELETVPKAKAYRQRSKTVVSRQRSKASDRRASRESREEEEEEGGDEEPPRDEEEEEEDREEEERRRAPPPRSTRRGSRGGGAPPPRRRRSAEEEEEAPREEEEEERPEAPAPAPPPPPRPRPAAAPRTRRAPAPPAEDKDADEQSSPAAPQPHAASLLRHKTCKYELPNEQSARPGPPCIPPAKKYPYKTNTPWRTDFGERITRAVTPKVTTKDCGGWIMFGDHSWCKKAMQRKDVLGLSFGIEERDLFSEYLSNKFGIRTRLYDCFQRPEDSPPLKGTAPNGTQACQWGGSHCYETPYEAYQVCLGAEKGKVEGRRYENLHNLLKGQGKLSTHVKIDVEGSEWTVLEQLVASDADQAKVRTLDMEVHFGFRAASEAAAQSPIEKERLEREIRIMESLLKRFYCTGTTLEVYRQGWRPEQDCPKATCDEPIVHLAGGFTPKMFAVSYVNKMIVDGESAAPEPAEGDTEQPADGEERAPEASEEDGQGEAGTEGETKTKSEAGAASPRSTATAKLPPVKRKRVTGCKSENPGKVSSRPGVPCLPPARDGIWPYTTNTKWRSVFGERIADAATPHVTSEQCGGFVMFGDQTWCNKAFGAKNVIGYSYGIEERDMYSEYLSQNHKIPCHLFDCFQNPRDSPPLSGKAANATGKCRKGSEQHCYEAPYYPHRVCLGPEKAEIGGREYDTLVGAMRGKRPLSVHLKIDVEGSEWTPLDQFTDDEKAQDAVRTLDMEVHFGFSSESESEYRSWKEQKRLEREVAIFEKMQKRFYVTGTTLEEYREGWKPWQDCPQQQCDEPAVHLEGGFTPRMFAISFVNRAILDNDDEPVEKEPAAAVEEKDAAAEEKDGGDGEAESPGEDGSAEMAKRARAGDYRATYGFYLHVYMDPAAVVYQVRQVKKHFPKSPIYVMSDGGMDFGELCKQEGCIFNLCPPANDRWHPWPFLRRLWDGALALNTQFVIMLEPDNTIHRPITRAPTADAGGLPVPGRRFGVREYITQMAQEHKPGYKWTDKMMEAGLAGGAYFRTVAILDAFSDEAVAGMNWNKLADLGTKEIFSSDFAMQYMLASRGYTIEPWQDCAQMDRDKDKPISGLKDSAFRHYCGCYPGGKPTYNLALQAKDKRLVGSQRPEHSASTSVCQICYNHSRYVKTWGSARCTNNIPFTYTKSLLKRYFPDGRYPQMLAGT